MTRLRLTRILTAIVASSSTSIGLGACTPCPYTEVARSFDVDIDAATACDLALSTFRVREIAPSIDPTMCAATCKDPEVNACALDAAYLSAFFAVGSTTSSGTGGGGAGGGGTGVGCPTMPTKATLTCQVTVSGGEFHDGCPIAGRRPATLELPGRGAGSAGEYLARGAHLEAASVIAFARLARDLEALGAPADLLEDVREAEQDEIRHAASMRALAEARGAEVPEPEVAPYAPRPAVEVALENAVEGMVRETFGAAVAMYQARHAGDPAVRAACAQIAADECAHAALSFRVARFVEAGLGPKARERIAAARREAVSDLRDEIEHAERSDALGLPARAIARGMLAQIAREVWNMAPAA